MCNLYQMTPRDDLEVWMRRAAVRSWSSGVVGPYGLGGIVRSIAGGLVADSAQWGMAPPGSKQRRPASRSILTNNARIEGISERVTYRGAWAAGRRCLIPAVWYQEPNWETGRNVWWQLRRADGAPWMLAGIWGEWTDPETGEVLPNYSMITCNCDGHSLLGRLHKPDPALPDDAQDKRAVVHLAEGDWDAWLHGSAEQARALVRPAPVAAFDLSVTRQVDVILDGRGAQGALI